MVEKNSVEPDVKKQKVSGCMKPTGCSVGCLSLIVLFIAFGIFSMYMSTPQILGDKDKIIEDISRYHQRYGNWPQSIEELKSKLPDYHFKHRYSYSHSDDMFLVSFQGSGLAGDDFGDFYRSDTKEWKSIYSNRKEFLTLEKGLSSSK